MFSLEYGYSKDIVDCNSLTHGLNECNPYSFKFLKTKDIKYIDDKKKPIVSKTLPTPKPIHIKIFSVQDIINKYIKYTKIEDSLRFNGELYKETYTNIVKPSYGLYCVSKGDILGRIANKFDVSMNDICKINKLDDNSTIKVGEKIKIPKSQDMVDAIVSGKYKVKKGDNFILIAKRFGIDLKLMKKYNHLKNTQMIKEGDILKLPLSHILKKEKKIAIKKSKHKIKFKKIKHNKKRDKIFRFISNFSGHRLRVTATAYSSHTKQTDSTPFLAAWNNHIRPGMKIIAVSRDLLTRYGIKNGTKIHISGLRGYYIVKDKMNKRFKRRIDIYMGLNRRRALRWGRRSVIIYW